ncbi:Cloroperoxidase, partial [Laetiporus sulphureus 93-53]
HRHSTGLCPVIGPDSRAYCPPQKGDSRSPCPALNTLANHGYLPRDGKCITPQVLMHALEKGYNLSGPLAWVLVRGGFYLLGQRRERICLRDLARHNCIEHNASLIHRDAHERDEYAPIRNHLEMMDLLLSHSKDGVLMTTDDVARARVHRELEYENAMDRLHAEIARGEMAIVKRVLGIKPKPQTAPLPGVPNDILRTWMLEERLPDDWRPYHKTGLLHVIRTSNHLRHSMETTEKELDVNEIRRENTLR